MRARALADDQHAAFGEDAAQAARVVHVVMREHQRADRLAREARARLADEP